MILEPNGADLVRARCRWMGLPAKAVYDIQLHPLAEPARVSRVGAQRSRRVLLQSARKRGDRVPQHRRRLHPAAVLRSARPPAGRRRAHRQRSSSSWKTSSSRSACRCCRFPRTARSASAARSRTAPTSPRPIRSKTRRCRSRSTTPAAGRQRRHDLTLQIDNSSSRPGIHAIDPADQPQVQFRRDADLSDASRPESRRARWASMTSGRSPRASPSTRHHAGQDDHRATRPSALVGVKFGVSIARLAQGHGVQGQLRAAGRSLRRGPTADRRRAAAARSRSPRSPASR